MIQMRDRDKLIFIYLFFIKKKLNLDSNPKHDPSLTSHLPVPPNLQSLSIASCWSRFQNPRDEVRMRLVEIESEYVVELPCHTMDLKH